MMYKNVINFIKSIFHLIFTHFGICNTPNNIDVDILYMSNDYIIVNKPEDVFINNHHKKVSFCVKINSLNIIN